MVGYVPLYVLVYETRMSLANHNGLQLLSVSQDREAPLHSQLLLCVCVRVYEGCPLEDTKSASLYATMTCTCIISECLLVFSCEESIQLACVCGSTLVPEILLG